MTELYPGQEVEVYDQILGTDGKNRRNAKIVCVAGVESTSRKTLCYCVEFSNGINAVFDAAHIRAIDGGGAIEDAKNGELLQMGVFLSRVRSLFCIDHHLLPELNAREWKEFRDDPPRYCINHADLAQLKAIWREVEKRQ